jgi:hypothetical protein
MHLVLMPHVCLLTSSTHRNALSACVCGAGGFVDLGFFEAGDEDPSPSMPAATSAATMGSGRTWDTTAASRGSVQQRRGVRLAPVARKGSAAAEQEEGFFEVGDEEMLEMMALFRQESGTGVVGKGGSRKGAPKTSRK